MERTLILVKPDAWARNLTGEIIARFERFELAGPLAWTNNNRLLGLTHLPVRAVPRA